MGIQELKRVITKGGLFLLSTAVVYLAIFFSITSGEIPPDRTFFHNDWADYFQGRGDAEIVIIGNSRALSSLSSGVIQSRLNKKTYNMAYSGTNLSFTEDVLASYLKKAMCKPSLCILEVSWCSFCKFRTKYPYNKPELVLKVSDARHILEDFGRYNSLLVELALKKLAEEEEKGYVDWWDGDPKKAPLVFDATGFNVDEMKKAFPTLEAGIDNELYRSYEEIIRTCKRNNIRLILYTAPEAPVYTALQKDKTAVKALILKSARDHGVDYFDFTVDGPYYSKELDRMLYNPEHVRRCDDFTRLFLEVLESKQALCRLQTKVSENCCQSSTALCVPAVRPFLTA